MASLKSDVDELDIDKLKTVTDDLSKLTNVVKSDVVKKTVYDGLVKKVNAIQTVDTSNFVIEIIEIEKRIPDHDK